MKDAVEGKERRKSQSGPSNRNVNGVDRRLRIERPETEASGEENRKTGS